MPGLRAGRILHRRNHLGKQEGPITPIQIDLNQQPTRRKKKKEKEARRTSARWLSPACPAQALSFMLPRVGIRRARDHATDSTPSISFGGPSAVTT